MSYQPKNQNGQATMANSEPVVIASDQSAVPVSGTVTANLSATDNAVLDAIAASVDTIDSVDFATQTTLAAIKAKTDNIPAQGQALAAASIPVVLTAAQITTLTPPAAITGFGTAANQTTIIGHVDGIEGLLTTIDSDTGTIATEVAGLLTDTELRATPVPVSGTVTANLSATDNAVLDDIALDTEAIKTSLAGTLTVTGGGGGVEYTEGDTDATIVGSAIMFESNTGTNTLSAVSNTTPLPISDAGGAITVDGTVAVTNAGITTIAGAVSGTEMQVDVLTMPTTAVTGTFWQATQPVSLTSTTVTGTVAVTQSGTWDEVGINDSGNSITVDYATTGSGTATGALRVELPTNGTGTVGLNAGTNNIGDVDILSIAAGDNNIGNVDIVSGTVTTVTTLTGGGIAHDSADSGNPHKVGMIAYSPDGTTPGTAVAELDRTHAKGNLDGQLFVQTEHPRWGSYHVDGSSALTDATVAASPGAGFQTVITNITFSSGAATAINMFLEEGATKIFGPIYLEAVAGRGFCTPAGFRKHVTAATAVTITTSAAIAHSVDIQYETVAV